MDLAHAVAEERARIADWLETLDADQWSHPSCCGDWTVLETAAHLLAGPVNGVRGTLPFLIKARGSFARTNDLVAEDLAANGPDWVLARLRDEADSRFRPPGFGFEAPLTDVTIHGQDLTRPFDVVLDVPNDRWRHALETATNRRYAFFSARTKLKGLRFEATDLDFAAGDGPLVRGPARDVAHVMWGRPHGLAALDGDGVATLSARLDT